MLDTFAGGSFTYKTAEEGEALLDRILENTPPLEPLRVELEPCFEEVSSAEAETNAQPKTSSPEPDELRENPMPFHASITISLTISVIIRSIIKRRSIMFMSLQNLIVIPLKNPLRS